MWNLDYVVENLPIIICILAVAGIALGIFQIVKGRIEKHKNYILNGIAVMLLCAFQFACSLCLPANTVEKSGVVKTFTAKATVEKAVNADGKYLTYISYNDKLVTLDDEGYFYMLNNHEGEDIELKYIVDIMEDGSFDNCKLNSIEIISQS